MSRNDSYQCHNMLCWQLDVIGMSSMDIYMETIDRIKFLHRYLDLESTYIEPHLFLGLQCLVLNPRDHSHTFVVSTTSLRYL